MKNPFTSHPHSIDETYVQHLMYAWKSAFSLLTIMVALVIHGIFPFLFTHFGFERLNRINEQWQKRQKKSPKLRG